MSSPSWPEVPVGSLAIHLDFVGGIAGDMFVAAMLDAMPSLAPIVFAELAKMQPTDAGVPALTPTKQAGMRAMRFGLAQRKDRSASVVAPPAHAGTRYLSLRDRIASAPLEAATRREALALLATLAEAEAHVHDLALEDVHFHELADWDSLLDVVAAGCIAAQLADAKWTASVLPLGGGTVKTAHGVLPVPTPATAHLLVDYPWRDDGIGGERVTPTGAAILRHLVPAAHCGGPRPAGRLRAIGTGAGTKLLPGMANVTRALVFERMSAAASDEIQTIEFDIDDMTGEEIGHAADRLRAVEGVLDVSIGTRIGKKGRPMTDVRVLVAQGAVDRALEACFLETSTLGLRIQATHRHVLRREQTVAHVGDGEVGVKIAQRPDGGRTAKAEHDDASAQGSLAERRRTRGEAERQALERDD